MKIHSITGKWTNINNRYRKEGEPEKKRAFFLNLKLVVQIDGKETDINLSAMYVDGKRFMCRGKGVLPPKVMVTALAEAEGIFKALQKK